MNKRTVLSLLTSLLALGALFSACTAPPAGDSRAPRPALFHELDEGIAFWHERATRDPADFIAHNKLGNLYYQRARLSGDIADYQRAGSAYQAALHAHPSDYVDAILGLGFVATASHDFEDAVALANRALAIDPGEGAALAIRGDAYVVLGDYEAARADYTALVEAAPGLATHARLAILQALLGGVEESEATWMVALADTNASTADLAWGLAEYGNFQLALGNLTKARTNYAASLQLVTGFLPAELGLADVRAAQGDLDRAIRTYELAVQRAPAPETALKLGDLLVAAGREEDAASQYALVEAFAALFAANGITTDVTMIHYLADHGRAVEALAMARALYRDRPGIYAADALAWALHQSGLSTQAVPFAEEAVRFGTPDARLFYRAGVILAAAGDSARAAELLAAALDLNPRFAVLEAPEAVRLLSEVTGRVAVAR